MIEKDPNRESNDMVLKNSKEYGVVRKDDCLQFECKVPEKLAWDDYCRKINTVRFIIGKNS